LYLIVIGIFAKPIKSQKSSEILKIFFKGVVIDKTLLISLWLYNKGKSCFVDLLISRHGISGCGEFTMRDSLSVNLECKGWTGKWDRKYPLEDGKDQKYTQ